jgi:peptidoglycan/xylan/chitin deacetylase (PgdA/CDA1 family)
VGDRLILAYHAVSASWPTSLAIEPERLDAQLGVLADLGYEGVTFTEAVTRSRSGKAVAITFDDGFRSVIDYAVPILSRHGFIGTVFVPTDYLRRPGPACWPNVNRWIGGPHEDELALLSWSDLASLVTSGWEVGSHGCSHPHLPDLDDAALHHELSASRRVCEERLGIACASLAYPYGDVDRRVMAATRECGYRAAAALPGKIHRPHPFRWPRVGIWRTDKESDFYAKLSKHRRRRLDLRTGKVGILPRWRFEHS